MSETGSARHHMERPALAPTDAPSTPYDDGSYFENPLRHSEDSEFKARQFLDLFTRVFPPTEASIRSYVDVGCGSGQTTRLVASGLSAAGFSLKSSRGYDVSPHVLRIPVQSSDRTAVEFLHGDFTRSQEQADLVTLFDVFEHIPNPVDFVKQVAQRCRFVGLHIPLDHSLNVCLQDGFRAKLRNPGHLVFLDTAAALNLLAFAGLRVRDYTYTLNFLAPSGRATRRARLILPLRRALARISPWLLSKTFGGISLMVVAESHVRNTTERRRA